jgi:hypothetical protein
MEIQKDFKELLESFNVHKFIQRHRNQKLLEKINAAYEDFQDDRESSLNTFMRSKHINMVDEKW